MDYASVIQCIALSAYDPQCRVLQGASKLDCDAVVRRRDPIEMLAMSEMQIQMRTNSNINPSSSKVTIYTSHSAFLPRLFLRLEETSQLVHARRIDLLQSLDKRPSVICPTIMQKAYLDAARGRHCFPLRTLLLSFRGLCWR